MSGFIKGYCIHNFVTSSLHENSVVYHKHDAPIFRVPLYYTHCLF